MRVGIFVEVVKAQFHTGISRYVKKLVETLVSQHHSDVTFYLYYQRKPGEQKLGWQTCSVQAHQLRCCVRLNPCLTAYPAIRRWVFICPMHK